MTIQALLNQKWGTTMKIENELDPTLRQFFLSENERALQKMADRKKDAVVLHLPMHTANMRVFDAFNGNESIREVIVPDLLVSVERNGINMDKQQIKKNAIGYQIASNGAAVPLAHIYSGSSRLCLGNIFVPPFVPQNSPQQPLETLFLHNDRNIGHGHPKIPMTIKQLTEVQDILHGVGIDEVNTDYTSPTSWVLNDTLWNIGHALLQKDPTIYRDDAFATMKKIIRIVFPQQTNIEVDK